MSDDLDSLLDSALDEYTALSSSNAPATAQSATSSHSNANQSNSVNINASSAAMAASLDPSAAQVDAMAQEFLAT
jgi:hypothetical protein